MFSKKEKLFLFTPIHKLNCKSIRAFSYQFRRFKKVIASLDYELFVKKKQ